MTALSEYHSHHDKEDYLFTQMRRRQPYNPLLQLCD